MKKVILIFCILFSMQIYSQNFYTFGKGGKILENGTTISQVKVEEIFMNNQPIIALYKTGRNKKMVGNILLYSGIGLCGFYASQYIKSGSKEQGLTDHTLGIAGLAIISLSFPIKSGYSKKIGQAVNLMNEDAKNPKTSFIESTHIIANSNGIGISLKL